MLSFNLAVLATCVSSASAAAVYQGFNYGSTYTNGSAVTQADFEALFTTASNLVGTTGWTSARLYTMVQGQTTNTPIEAIPAALDTHTTLLLGLWCSAGQAAFNNELAALNATIATYGSKLTDIVIGISVGSEDLYRNSPIGVENLSGPGAQPTDLVDYINQVKAIIANSPIANVPIGHVDTWTAWVNGTNSAVIDAIDFLGIDEYPYFQNTEANPVSAGYDLFFAAYNATADVSKGKPIWVTETGWPVSGNASNLGIASIANAQTYWDEVGCAIFGVLNTFWYTLQDSDPTTPSPSFGIIGSKLTTTPLFNLTCPANVTKIGPSANASSGSPTSSGSGSSSSSGSAKSGVSKIAVSTGLFSAIVVVASLAVYL